MSAVPAGPPGSGTVPINASQRSPLIISVANFLKDNKILKQRTGLLNNTEEAEFFRFKRLQRALLSDEYKKQQKNPKYELIPIKDEEEANKIFLQLLSSQMIIPIDKLHYSEIKQVKGWKPNRSKPTLRPSKKASFEPNGYYVWNYNKPNPFILLYSFLFIAGVFAIILFPLWPMFMRIGVWYLSMGLLCLIGLFFLIAIIRLIIFAITYLVLPQAFWLYPNLFEDCSVIESFKPLYAWDQPKSSKKKSKKSKGGLSESTDSSTSATATGSDSTGSGSTTKRKVVLEEVDE